MRIYVAGSSRDLARVQWAQQALRAAGHVITHDWTEVLAKASGPDETLDDMTAGRAAAEDLRLGVRAAQGFLGLLPSHPLPHSFGFCTEFGYAIARAELSMSEPLYRVILAGPRVSIFAAHPLVRRFDQDQDALRFLGCRFGPPGVIPG